MGIELTVSRKLNWTKEQCRQELLNLENDTGTVFFGSKQDIEERKQQFIDKLLSGSYGVFYPVDTNGEYAHLNPLKQKVEEINNLLHDQSRPDWSALYEEQKRIEGNFRNDLGHYAYGSMEVILAEVPLLNKWFSQDGCFYLCVTMDSVKEFRSDLEMAAAMIKERREEYTTVVPYSEQKTTGGMTIIQSGYDAERLLGMLRSFYRGTNLLIKFSRKFPGEEFCFFAH